MQKKSLLEHDKFLFVAFEVWRNKNKDFVWGINFKNKKVKNDNNG